MISFGKWWLILAVLTAALWAAGMLKVGITIPELVIVPNFYGIFLGLIEAVGKTTTGPSYRRPPEQ